MDLRYIQTALIGIPVDAALILKQQCQFLLLCAFSETFHPEQHFILVALRRFILGNIIGEHSDIWSP